MGLLSAFWARYVNRGFYRCVVGPELVQEKDKKADLGEKELKWGYFSSKGYYIGYKLTMVIEYPSLMPVAFLLHQGSPGDAKLYE